MDMVGDLIEKKTSETMPVTKVRASKPPVGTAANIARTAKPVKTEAIKHHKS